MDVPYNLLGAALAAFAAVCIAFQALCIRVGTVNGRSNDALFVVVLVNLAILLPAALILDYPDYGLTLRSTAAFAMAGLLGTLTGRALLYAGIQRIGASRAEPIKASMPLFAALVAVAVLGETLTPENLAGILLIIVGVVLISRESSRDPVNGSAPAKYMLLPLGAAFFFGVEPTFAKLGFAEGTSVMVGLAIKTFVASVGLVGLQWYRGALPDPATLRSRNVWWYLGAGIASTLFLASFYSALEIAPVVLVTPIMQTSPLLVVVLSAIFLKRLERVTWRVVTAAAFVVAGAVAVTTFG